MASDKDASTSRKGLTRQTLSGFFWQTSGVGAQGILQLAVLTILARLLSQTDFGLISIAYIVISFAELFYQFGLGPSLIQRKNLTADHIRSAFTLTMILGALLSAIIWLSAPFFATFFKDAPGLTDVLRGLSFLFFINSSGLVARSLNYRNLNYRIKSIFQTGSYALGYGVVGISLAFLGFGAWALVWAAIVQAVVLNVAFIFTSPHDARPKLNASALSDLLSFGAGLTTGEIFQRIAVNVDNLIVGNTMGAAAVGIYGRAFQLMSLPSRYLGNILDSVLFTAMAKVQDEPKTMRAIYRRGTTMVALLVTPISAVLFIFAPEAVHFLYGSRWDEVVVPVQIFAGTMVFRLGFRISDMVTKATGAVYKRAFRQAIYAVLVIIGAWVGHYWGIVGVTIGVSLASIINFLSMVQLVSSVVEMNMRELLKIYIPMALLSLFILLESWGLASLLRNLSAPGFLTLVVGTAVATISGIGLIWFAPKTFLGADGEWILKTLINYLPARFKRRFVRSPA